MKVRGGGVNVALAIRALGGDAEATAVLGGTADERRRCLDAVMQTAGEAGHLVLSVMYATAAAGSALMRSGPGLCRLEETERLLESVRDASRNV